MSPQKKQLTTSQNSIVPWHLMAGVEELRTMAGQQMSTVPHTAEFGAPQRLLPRSVPQQDMPAVQSLCLLPAKGSLCQEQRASASGQSSRFQHSCSLTPPRGRGALPFSYVTAPAALPCATSIARCGTPTAQLTSRI